MSPNVFNERGETQCPTAMPTDLLAICFLWLSDCPDWNGAVLNRAGKSRVAA
jgi:hypothetical protein